MRKQAARHLQPDDGVDGRAVRADEPAREREREREREIREGRNSFDVMWYDMICCGAGQSVRSDWFTGA